MKKIGIYYGSTTGTTEGIAKELGKKLGVDSSSIKEISLFKPEEFLSYDLLLLGTSTWGDGEMQDDWYEAIEEIKQLDLSNHKIALFGCGDASSYSDTFCDAVGTLYQELSNSGCTFVGAVSTDGYTFDDSQALVGDSLVGLLLDEDNESELTEARIDAWVKNLQATFA